MITEDYVSFETAKLLKEKGFDEASVMYYPKDGGEMAELDLYDLNYNRSKYIKCPTQAITMKWLREEKNFIINVWYNGVDWDAEYYNNEDENFYLITDSSCNSYEEAAEAGIKYCLENLI